MRTSRLTLTVEAGRQEQARLGVMSELKMGLASLYFTLLYFSSTQIERLVGPVGPDLHTSELWCRIYPSNIGICVFGVTRAAISVT